MDWMVGGCGGWCGMGLLNRWVGFERGLWCGRVEGVGLMKGW